MAGLTSLRSQEELLAQYCNILQTLVDKSEGSSMKNGGTSWDPVQSQRIQATVWELGATSKLVNETLASFTAAVDSLSDPLSEERNRQVEEGIEKTLLVLQRAQKLAIELEANRISARDHASTSQEATGTAAIAVARPKLPAIPVPIFTGKVWDFENFWALFAANVHNQPLTPLQKFNYLVNALRGEARESIRRFAITEANYEHAIEFLRRKYGDESRLICCLQSRLEDAKASDTSLLGQRRLLEQLLQIVTQLEEKGVTLVGSFLTQKILAKFTSSIQRKVLEQRMTLPMQENNWRMRDILTDIDRIIDMEERINRMVQNPGQDNRKRSEASRGFKTQKQQGYGPCMFCNSHEHKAAVCPKYATIDGRKDFFREHDRCLNCGAPGHFTRDCTKEGCRLCEGRKHHHTLCPQRMKPNSGTHTSPQKEQDDQFSRRNASQWETPRSGNSSQQRKAANNRAHTHTVDTELCEASAEAHRRAADAELCVTAAHGAKRGNHDRNSEIALSAGKDEDVRGGREPDAPTKSHNVWLLTGVAHVKDIQHNRWRKVEILLDTGADQSFISAEMANKLGLVCNESKDFKIHTFGSSKARTATCGLTKVEVKDALGMRHELHVYTTPVVTTGCKTAQLGAEDLAFIAQKQIRLSKTNWRGASKPQILIGCDQLWTLLDTPHPRFQLPSGLHLIPSKLGYLLTGRQNTKESPRKDVTGAMTASVSTLINFEEERDRWDKYWTMDSAGVCEFTGTKNAEKEAINKQVEEFFEDTIQKREDGYYVRLPYKDNHPPLPTNKAIALKRLGSTIESLRRSPLLLQEYDKTFKEQQEKGIIEEVDDPNRTEGTVLHYIPHQPVLTPHKETTKLRIVFDASAHFKDRPSLNDVLHQGPLILPDLYAVLLRFRLPKYIVIADVEKAFLQVRLQEQDRDATRFLWVKDLKEPVDDSNIRVLRFTRVTFGLNVSPYLLAGTIKHHLRYEVENQELAKEIQNNLYVDNLALSADTEDEAIFKSLEARQIFTQMGMNLREFLSNYKDLQEALPEGTGANSTTQKILGITWNSIEDTLSISCTISPSGNLTKRQVARQISSIFDPMGWLVPLLMPAKKFQQDLWKQEWPWDTKLPEPICAQWADIVESIDKFQRGFPRRYTDDTSPTQLAVFADASESAIAACAYLFNEASSTLVMGKGKLPSLKTKTTMPKLEMNALTLAVRLSFSITKALRTSNSQNPSSVYIFSDSQIALSWVSAPRRKNLGVLVTNRLHEIQRIVRELEQMGVTVKFAYVNTSENPADAGTRGLSKAQLENHIWWTGPPFLKQPERYWYNTFYELASDEGTSEEEGNEDDCNINTVRSQTSSITDLLPWERFNSLTAAKRITALVLRFVKRIVNRLTAALSERIRTNITGIEEALDCTEALTGSELRSARFTLVRNHQAIHLSPSYRKSMENTLRLYEDDNRLWRSKGRLGNAMLEDETKSPLFIAPNTPLAKLIIHEAHGAYHSGVEHTINKVRQQYWIPKLRQQVRKVIGPCVKCRRFNALPYRYPETTDLPHQRVLKCQPFQNTGLDFFDLPPCRDNGKEIKLYGCIFTCTVTRLIHLEVVRSMATEEFINALRRFIARRGLPQNIICDNAPTFLLSENILNQSSTTIRGEIRREVANREIHWSHITPYAPWQGGFYERLIKSIKHAIYKTLRGTNRRTLDDIHTFVAEVEANLNSRPLTYQGEAQESLSCIRPIDFIQRNITITLPLSEETSIKEDDPEYLPPDGMRAFQYRMQVIKALNSSVQDAERFWNIWQQQYLLALRETHKKNTSNRRQGLEIPKIGDVVLVSDPVLPRNEWRMGRITEIRRSSDGEIREVELATSTKRRIRRPVNLLIPLEIQAPRESSEDKPISHGAPSPRQPREEDRQDLGERGHPYNLRRRKPKNYAREVVIGTTQNSPRRFSGKWFLFYIMIFIVTHFTCANTPYSMATRDRRFTGTNGVQNALKCRVRTRDLSKEQHHDPDTSYHLEVCAHGWNPKVLSLKSHKIRRKGYSKNN